MDYSRLLLFLWKKNCCFRSFDTPLARGLIARAAGCFLGEFVFLTGFRTRLCPLLSLLLSSRAGRPSSFLKDSRGWLIARHKEPITMSFASLNTMRFPIIPLDSVAKING